MSIRFRRGTDAQFQANKSNILPGEPAFTTDTHRFFVGYGGNATEFLSMRNITTLMINSSTTLTVPNNFKGVVMGFRYASTMVMYMVVCDSSGVVSVADISGSSDVAITTGINSITINNNTGVYNLQLYYLGTDILKLS